MRGHQGRRAALFSIIDDIGAQAFMTGTDRALFDALAGRAGFFEVAGGEVWGLAVSRPATDSMT
jgi:DNA replication and repair protein RecF